MLSQRKQNTETRLPNTTHRSSTQACKQMLKDFCFPHPQLQGQEVLSSTLKQIKLREGVAFLQRKTERQSEQIIFLTHQLAGAEKRKQQSERLMKDEKEKNQKLQANLGVQSKLVSDLKKKIAAMEENRVKFENKSRDLQGKMLKLKQLLRKKELQVSDLQSRIGTRENLDSVMLKQKQELASLRTNFVKVKAREDELEQENSNLKQKLQECIKNSEQTNEKYWMIEESNKRLEDQCQELQQICEQERKDAAQIEDQLRVIMEEQAAEINKLRESTRKIQQLQCQSCESSVYWTEIARILKQNVNDKNIRNKLQKQISEVMTSMEEGWNKILMQVIASTVY